MSKFAATVGDWADTVIEAQEAVFRESAQEFVAQLNSEVTAMIYDQPQPDGYTRTGFLRASLVASTEALPNLLDDDGNAVAADAHMGAIVLVINGWEPGQSVFLGYTAKYGARLHFGYTGPDSLGRTFNQAPRPWVTMVTQRWAEIVAAKEAAVKQRFGL